MPVDAELRPKAGMRRHTNLTEINSCWGGERMLLIRYASVVGREHLPACGIREQLLHCDATPLVTSLALRIVIDLRKGEESL
jgi:hypothetical protein